MTPRPANSITSRDWCWDHGIRLRELLVARYMALHGMRDRPLLAMVIDGLIEDALGARVLDDVLPLDRFAQTEVVKGKIEISVNTLISEMPRVKDPRGVGYVSRWHEVVHAVNHVGMRDPWAYLVTVPLPGFTVRPPLVSGPRAIVCRQLFAADRQFDRREFVAENAGLAAAIAAPDLARCSAFACLRNLGMRGGELDGRGWMLLRKTAHFVGVNASSLERYFQRRELIEVVERQGRRQLIATKHLYRGLEWLEPDLGRTKFIA